jgi:transposase
MMTPREAELMELLRQKDEQIARLTAHISLLEQKVDLLVRRIFGARSEKLNAAQLELLLLQEDAAGKAPASPEGSAEAGDSWEAEAQRSFPRRSRAEREARLPENLPVIEQVIDPEEVSADPAQWRCIDEEVSEQLDYEPARFLRRRLIRRKYVKRSERYLAPVIAPLPPSLQERCIAAPGLLAQILVSKYCDHLPLYRQEQIFAQRHGVHLPRQSLARWVGLAAEWLRPLYEELRTGVMGGGYVQVDETPVPYLCPGNGQSKQGYFWTCSRPGGEVIYQWRTSRASSCLDNLVPVDFRGTLQCDGYSAYASFAARREGRIRLAGCWAHVRRKFYEAREQAPRQAGWLLRQMGQLYLIEKHLRERRAGPALREAVRAAQSRPIIKRLQAALLKLKAGKHHLPQSAMGKAIAYTLGQWPALTVYAEGGQVEIDNNLVENAIRPTAIGKKNWLFIGEAEAGWRSAVIYTLIENCRRLRLDAYTYLRDLLTRLPHMTNRQIKDVTPKAWAKAQKQRLALKAAS